MAILSGLSGLGLIKELTVRARSRHYLFITELLMMLGLCACSIGHEGPVSDHFNGNRFVMEGTDHSFADMVKWMWEMETVEWPGYGSSYFW